MQQQKFLIGLVLAMSTCIAQALPVTTEDVEGQAGSDVTVVLSDTVAVPVDPVLDAVFAVGVKVVYDSTILTFKGGAPGTIRGFDIFDPTGPGVSLLGADPTDPLFFIDMTVPTASTLILSLAYPFPEGATPGAGSLMDLVFTIDPLALPGTTTTVDFSCDDFFGFCDYPFSPVSSTVTVLQRASNPMPLPGTLPLLGVGVAALLWARRRTK
ncbi:hypothetical protein O4H66_07460 [Comamonadaceae bacterium G21597-S1]|nr:hypothetical protein [Comamonadaceae bacterium G21597-S1]